ncbi:stellacyanin [Mercurialis annua]|uniref:stellacyanin n=1 Tax=Mercurialis annua TaxID=3986 RepID=UPI00215EB020|nr:stellacyanin [Mercurialis annua]
MAFSSLVILHLVATSFNVFHARGITFTVGDLDGWSPFTNFSNWLQGKEFHVGDVLDFNYPKGAHTVMQVNSNAYEECIKDTHIRQFTNGNDSMLLTEATQMWFICGVSNHCENGQKLTINVTP